MVICPNRQSDRWSQLPKHCESFHDVMTDEDERHVYPRTYNRGYDRRTYVYASTFSTPSPWALGYTCLLLIFPTASAWNILINPIMSHCIISQAAAIHLCRGCSKVQEIWLLTFYIRFPWLFNLGTCNILINHAVLLIYLTGCSSQMTTNPSRAARFI